jgi:hypothetical protein
MAQQRHRKLEVTPVPKYESFNNFQMPTRRSGSGTTTETTSTEPPSTSPPNGNNTMSIIEKGMNVKREAWAQENRLPALYTKMRERFPTGRLVSRTHMTTEHYFTNPNVYINRVRQASLQQIHSIIDTYGNDTDGESDGFPSNITRYINSRIDLINKIDAAGLLEWYIDQAHNEPRDISNATLVNLYERYIIAVRGRTKYTGPIILPLNDWAHDGNGMLPYVDRLMNTDPLDRVYFSLQIYWWHSDLCGQGRGRTNQNASGSRACCESYLQNRGILALHTATDGRVVCTEIGVHYRNNDPLQNYPNDLEAFNNFMDIFNELGIDVVMEATSPYRGGYDFPIHQNPVTKPGQTIYGMTPQLQVFINKVGNGGSPTTTTEPPPPMYDIEYPTNTSLPLRVVGETNNSEITTFTINEDPETFESTDMLINLTDTEWPNEGTFSVNGSVPEALPQSGNAQSKDFIIPLDPATLQQGNNEIEFIYTYPNETWGYRINTLSLGVNISSSTTTATSTTSPPTPTCTTTTTTEPPQTEYATKDELNSLAEIVDINSEAIALNAKNIVALETQIIEIQGDIKLLQVADAEQKAWNQTVEIRLAEQLAMIQRIEANRAQLKNCIQNSL